MASRDLHMKGLEDTLNVLAALPGKIQTQVVRQGLTAAAAVVREEARRRVPKQTGLTARSIGSGKPRKNQDGTYSISVRLVGRNAFIGHFIEYGVRPHVITAGDSHLSARAINKRARRSGRLHRTDKGLTAVGGYDYYLGPRRDDVDEDRKLKIKDHYISGAVMHPGFRALPFLVPALDTKAEEATAAMAAKIAAAVESKTGFVSPAGTAGEVA